MYLAVALGAACRLRAFADQTSLSMEWATTACKQTWKIAFAHHDHVRGLRPSQFHDALHNICWHAIHRTARIQTWISRAATCLFPAAVAAKVPMPALDELQDSSHTSKPTSGMAGKFRKVVS
eukprot:TRINITY_DN54341_c0_g1_i1.p1 TRINITY_DN54341_c0_g1~~TRINITY_DN54341_c0_g1_i1.p1  ORF type:complete len:122 (-),score=15.63 TRINITY_DN54341_c0_g1_i1:60-425(-)